MGAEAVPNALRGAGMMLTTMEEAGYPRDAKDVDWIPEVAARGWVILTKDKNIRRTSLELEAVLASDARFFTLGKASYSAAAMAAIVLHHRDTIERLVLYRQAPVIVQINKGEVLLRGKDGQLRRVKRKTLRRR